MDDSARLRSGRNFDRELTEKALYMRCQAYLSQVKSRLLTLTIYGVNNSKNLLKTEIEERKRIEAELREKTVQLEELNKQLEASAVTDHLTQIYNRLYFDKAIEREIARYKRYGNSLSLILFDIDHFKHVNDSLGHHAGDRVLQTMAILVKQSLRKSDVFARWGGEEFIILLPESNVLQGLLVAEKLREKIATSTILEERKITCSFGVTEFRTDESYESFAKRADTALYEAKNTGRNRTVYLQ